MTTGKTIALTRETFVGKVMSLLVNMLSRLVITFYLEISLKLGFLTQVLMNGLQKGFESLLNSFWICETFTQNMLI